MCLSDMFVGAFGGLVRTNETNVVAVDHVFDDRPHKGVVQSAP